MSGCSTTRNNHCDPGRGPIDGSRILNESGAVRKISIRVVIDLNVVGPVGGQCTDHERQYDNSRGVMAQGRGIRREVSLDPVEGPRLDVNSAVLT